MRLRFFVLAGSATLLSSFLACGSGDDEASPNGPGAEAGTSSSSGMNMPTDDGSMHDDPDAHHHDMPDGDTLPPGVRAYEPQPVHYPPLTVQPTPREVPGDKSTPNGGTPPATAWEPADIPTTGDTTGLIIDSPSFREPNGEAKARFTCASSHIGANDPLRAYGQPGASHLHQFFGNPNVDAFSTYDSLRHNTVNGTCSGGILNNTAYWFPCFIKQMPDGSKNCVRAQRLVLYYNEGNLALVPSLQRVFRGFGYVMGFNMDDPDDTAVKAEVARANQESVAAGGRDTYQYTGNGFGGYSCHLKDNSGTLVNGSGPGSPVPGGEIQPYLANEDGSPTMPNCPAGAQIRASVVGPTCWDGVNLQSYPSGYKHVRHGIRERDYAVEDICPTGWYRIPRVQITFWFDYDDVADFTSWRLSSDDHAAMVAGHPIPNGASFHTDWFGGWDYGTEENPGVMLQWMHNCNGVRRPDGTNTPHDCDSSTFSPTQALNYGMVQQIPYTRYFPIP